MSQLIIFPKEIPEEGELIQVRHPIGVIEIEVMERRVAWRTCKMYTPESRDLEGIRIDFIIFFDKDLFFYYKAGPKKWFMLEDNEKKETEIQIYRFPVKK